jgi:ASC-1-like (ASCH) protein
MNYVLHIPDRPWQAIKNGTKKVEGRVYRHTTPYQDMKAGDTITFINEGSQEKLITLIKYVNHYRDVRTMLQTEGVENVLSSGGSVEDGVRNFEAFTDYKANIPFYGIYAICVSLHRP